MPHNADPDDLRLHLSAAKLWLTATPTATPTGGGGPVGNAPYLAHALYALRVVPTPEVEDLAADQDWRLYANPDTVVAMPVPEVGRRLAHLLWHLLYDHSGRARSMDVIPATAAAWATATHLVIGETLDQAALTPHPLPRPASTGLPAGRSAEEHYARLSRMPPPTPDDPGTVTGGCGSACDGLTRGYEQPARADLGALTPAGASALRHRVAIELRHHLLPPGTQPGECARWVEHILEPRLPWPQLLATAVRRALTWTAGALDYTYTRPSRRQAACPDIRLPGLRRPVPTVAIVLDTSGSIDNRMLAQALGEIDGVLRGTGVSGRSITVISCDAQVQAVTAVRAAEQVSLGGGGGTDLRHGITAATRVRPRPDILIVLTDGQTPWPAQRPPLPATIAALFGHADQPLPTTPPWAARVECRVD